MLQKVMIKGYRPFRDLEVELGPLTVLVGANGSGKSSLFEFLRFIRDSVDREIPPEIVPGYPGRRVFHSPGPERFEWKLDLLLNADHPVGSSYEGGLTGPIGRIQLLPEQAIFPDGSAVVDWSSTGGRRLNRLALSLMTDPDGGPTYALRETILGWRFYNALHINHEKIRKPVLVEQNPTLREDCGNISSVLHHLMTEHPQTFDQLQTHLRSVVPGFRRLNVKARGAPGEVIAFWTEDGLDDDLTLADLSDGTLRLVCWTTLAMLPDPPPLICVDEPDQGVHPRTSPVLAGLFSKATERTQVLLSTHSSYFLAQFKIDEIGVFRRVDGATQFAKVTDSAALMEQLEDFGPHEIELLHRSDELEHLA